MNVQHALNLPLSKEGFEAYYSESGVLFLKHLGTQRTLNEIKSMHRALNDEELKKRKQLAQYLDVCSEDELIEEILFPLFRVLGYQRVTIAGHRDKALEYGKDIWMKFVLPTEHVLYFGIQVKKGKLDSSGISKSGNQNIAEIHNQASMMLGHEIFDHDTNKRVLVDHAYIIAGGVITKAARNWLGNKLDATKRSQIIFMDRDDLLNLFVINSLTIPNSTNKDDIENMSF